MRVLQIVLVLLLACANTACGAQPSSAPPEQPKKPESKAAPAPAQAVASPASSSAAPSPVSSAAPTAVGANVLVNPGFEAGQTGWTKMAGENWGAFEIVDSPVHSGAHSARLVVRAGADSPEKAKVFGVVQEIRRDTLPGEFPDVVSGWYRINEWNKPASGADMYIQMVVIIWGDPRAPMLIGQPAGQKPVSNYQIRFYLGGLVKPAFTLSNARLDFVAKGEPKTGEWVRFEVPVKQKFQELWGTVPAGYEFIRILFEARWDNKLPGVELHGDVTYDDLFFGYGKPPDAPH